MGKIKNYIIWMGLFLMVSCSNFSNLCRHDNAMGKGFGFTKRGQTGSYLAVNEDVFTGHGTDDGMPQKADGFTLTWNILADVTYKLKWNPEYQLDFNYPVFGNTIKKYKGKEVNITGYMIPLDINAGRYVISRYNYASCFFCGGGGPESIVTLKFKTKPKRYKTDEYLTMKGILELNDTNVNEYFYIFNSAEEVKQ